MLVNYYPKIIILVELMLYPVNYSTIDIVFINSKIFWIVSGILFMEITSDVGTILCLYLNVMKILPPSVSRMDWCKRLKEEKIVHHEYDVETWVHWHCKMFLFWYCVWWHYTINKFFYWAGYLIGYWDALCVEYSVFSQL